MQHTLFGADGVASVGFPRRFRVDPLIRGVALSPRRIQPMSYLVLARKYRPRNFSEMVGQEHVVQALITQGRKSDE